MKITQKQLRNLIDESIDDNPELNKIMMSLEYVIEDLDHIAMQAERNSSDIARQVNKAYYLKA